MRIRDLAIFTAGGLVFSGLWMFDELLTEAMFCKLNCLYPVPLIGNFSLYGAEGLAWLLIIGGVMLCFLSVQQTKRDQSQ